MICTLLLFDSGGICLPFNNGTSLNLKRYHKSNSEKSKLSVNNFFSLCEKISKTYIRILTTFITLIDNEIGNDVP